MCERLLWWRWLHTRYIYIHIYIYIHKSYVGAEKRRLYNVCRLRRRKWKCLIKHLINFWKKIFKEKSWVCRDIGLKNGNKMYENFHYILSLCFSYLLNYSEKPIFVDQYWLIRSDQKWIFLKSVIIVLVWVRAFRIYILFLSLNYFEKPIFVINIDWSDVIKNGWKSDHCTCLSESFQNIYIFPIFKLFWKTNICDQYWLIRCDQKLMKKWSLYLSQWFSEYMYFSYL